MGTSAGSPVPLFKIKVAEQGRIKDIKELVARIDGLPRCLNGQLVDMGDGVRGMVMGFTPEDVLVLVMGDDSHLRMGKSVTGTSEPFRIPVGHGFIGRMVTALGEPCDNRGPVEAQAQLPVLRDSPPITAREPVREFLPTGTKAIDMTAPLAKGQRLLIIGDRVTGKTTIGVDAILHQKGRDCICIFCAIGKSRSSIQKVASTLKESGAFDYTVMMVAADSAPTGERYLAPYAAATMAEFFAAQGRDVLVVFDDLTKHAWAYRQLSLLLDRPPGREAYPGDIFYVQTQLIERAGNFSPSHGGGAITFLAIAETLQGDLTGYIPSNLLAMCDGQVYMSSAAFAEGLRPAMDVLLSLSIVGLRVQPPALRRLSAGLRASLAQYHELTKLGALQSGLAEPSAHMIRCGVAIQTLLQQGEGQPASLAESVLLLYGLGSAGFAERPKDAIVRFREEILGFAERHDPDLVVAIDQGAEWSQDWERRMQRLLGDYFGLEA